VCFENPDQMRPVFYTAKGFTSAEKISGWKKIKIKSHRELNYCL